MTKTNRTPEGVKFRCPSEHEDFERLAKVVNDGWAADGIDAIRTADDFEKDFANPVKSNPKTDCLVVEVGADVVGFSEVTTEEKLGGEFRYWHYAHLLPEFRVGSLRRTMLEWNEERIKAIAEGHPRAKRQFIEVYANTKSINDWKDMIETTGYAPAWYLSEMVRSDLDNVPHFAFPEGVETRQVEHEDVRKIWSAAREALKDERNFTEERWNEDAFKREIALPRYDPSIWQIAWHGEQVVGGVLNYIDKDENESLGRKWGHTEQIFVERSWRRKGIARALIANSLGVMKDLGMEKATLDVDTENPSGALDLYKSLGYEMQVQFTFYRKELM